MIYAVIDTNVLVSALLSRNSNAATVKVFEAVVNGLICPLYNHEIIEEYLDVLSRDKFRLPLELIKAVVGKLQEIGIESNRIECYEVFPDKDDVVFYEVALSREDAFLVTGNLKHFPKSPIVVTPNEMLQMIISM